MQDAAFEMVVLQVQLGAQRLQAAPAVEARATMAAMLRRVRPGRHSARKRSPQASWPVGPPAPERWRIFTAQPFEQAGQDVRIGPRLGMRNRYLATVGEAGFIAGHRLTIDHRDLMPGPGEIPRTRCADHAGTQHEDSQASPPLSG
jgi:hypothetical protein